LCCEPFSRAYLRLRRVSSLPHTDSRCPLIPSSCFSFRRAGQHQLPKTLLLQSATVRNFTCRMFLPVLPANSPIIQRCAKWNPNSHILPPCKKKDPALKRRIPHAFTVSLVSGTVFFKAAQRRATLRSWRLCRIREKR